MPNPAENEPFSLTEGISAWPTAIIRLLALLMSIAFLWYSWRKLQQNERMLAQCFLFHEGGEGVADKASEKNAPPGPSGGTFFPSALFSTFASGMRRCISVHSWRPQALEQIDANRLWHEYVALGQWGQFRDKGTAAIDRRLAGCDAADEAAGVSADAMQGRSMCRDQQYHRHSRGNRPGEL